MTLKEEVVVANPKICFAIPARLNSTRVPGKMLLDFNGKPLVRNVFDEVKSWGYDTFVVTDSDEIAAVIPQENVKRTGEALNGSHRLSMIDWDYDIIVNVQGDMLGIDFDTVRPLIESIYYDEFDVATLYTVGAKDNDVKVIHTNGNVHWFTRSNIGYGDRHLGVYAYNSHILGMYDMFIDSAPSEDLEQLRYTSLDFIAIETKYNGTEINTEADINSRTM